MFSYCTWTVFLLDSGLFWYYCTFVGYMIWLRILKMYPHGSIECFVSGKHLKKDQQVGPDAATGTSAYLVSQQGNRNVAQTFYLCWKKVEHVLKCFCFKKHHCYIFVAIEKRLDRRLRRRSLPVQNPFQRGPGGAWRTNCRSSLRWIINWTCTVAIVHVFFFFFQHSWMYIFILFKYVLLFFGTWWNCSITSQK